MDSKCTLGESPRWNAQRKELFWTDIETGELWRYSSTANQAARLARLDMKVGGFVFSEQGEMILFSDKGVHAFDVDSNSLRQIFSVPLAAGERFNDITTDPTGRIFAGTLLPDRSDGRLYCFEKGKEPRITLTGLKCSNGMAFSLDEKNFYHTDSFTYTITKYKYDRKSGKIFDPEFFYQGEKAGGYPDGIAMDSQGDLWVAFWGGACICRIGKNGKVIQRIAMNIKNPTSLTFGGENLSQLFITSAAMEDVSEDAGGVFSFLPSNPGKADWLAQI